MGTKKQLKEERDRIVKGLEETYRKLLEFNKLNNRVMIISKDGKVIAADPNTLMPEVRYKRKAQ
jgi:sulfur carrier protein ThiS